MSDVSYWNSQIKKLQANPPKKSSSYYNQSFVDRINDAQKSIDSLVLEKDKSWAATQQAQNDYDAFRGTMRSFDDVYKNKQAEFGVENAMADYEKSKKALAMAELTLEHLPSSINAGSNRVLTQNQRENAYNVLSNQFNKVQEYQQKQNKTYEEAWKNAREKAGTETQAVLSGENAKLQDFNNAWVNWHNRYTDIENMWASERARKQQIEKDYRDWQLKQYETEMRIYQTALKNAQKRLQAANQTAMAQNQYNSQKGMYAKPVNTWSFGGGYVVKRNASGEAEYYKNNMRISAGEFLNAKAKEGMFDELWKAGLSTKGVGWDTIQAFARTSVITKNDKRYGYLFNLAF